MPTFFSDTFNGAVSPGDYALLEERTPAGYTSTWKRMQTGSTPNQNLIGSTGTCFRSAYNPWFGTDHANGSEHYVDIDGLPADYIVEATIKFLGEYVAGSGDPTDEPGEGSGPRVINTSGINNCTGLGNESHFRIQGRWTLNYKGYQLSYRASTGVWKLTVADGIGAWPGGILPNFEPGGHPLARFTTMPEGIHLGADLHSSDITEVVDRAAVVEYSSQTPEAPEAGGEDGDAQVGEFDYDEGGIILAMISYPVTPGRNVTCQLRMSGSQIEGRLIEDSVTTSVGTAIDESWVGSGIDEDNLVGLRFDAGSSPVKGIHCDAFSVHTDFTTGGGDDPGTIAAPVLTATLNINTATVTWPPVTGATYYTLYRGEECGSVMTYLDTITANGALDLSYIDSALDVGYHSYQAYAHDSTHRSAVSNCVEVLVIDIIDEPPPPPGEEPRVVWRWSPTTEEDLLNARECVKCKRMIPGKFVRQYEGRQYCYDHVPIKRRRPVQ